MHTRDPAERRATTTGRLPDRSAVVPQLDLVDWAEWEQLVVSWNATASEFVTAPVAELFEAQVDRSPDEVAVMFEATRLTYGELDRRANRLARRLRELGVGPDVVVGLCVDRSLEMGGAARGA